VWLSLAKTLNAAEGAASVICEVSNQDRLLTDSSQSHSWVGYISECC